ncbi:RDD family protein 2 [Bordetella trematum]|uniref:Membrane protein n=1 Tax=Bordetella trematum TaxID=123899 RepID=A0A157SL45_9BORD|nr:RDD family protein [Bordetella trematum]AUL46735.1 RDD family protein [Bordetella trematum]AZR93528.1 RDD family protein 2 [Bordetella trematum]NNH21312.1 RDD family protein [Bordetella trematum]QIM72115.1 RDD family protein [Bordetella trematum]SAI14814.1 membrane protein [Bordetella trematum]
MFATAPTPASRRRRLASMLYEAVLLFGVGFVATLLFDLLIRAGGFPLLRQTWLFLAIGLYFLLNWYARGQTLAMKTWRLRLLDRHDRRPAPARLLLRYLLLWPLPLACAWLLHQVAQAGDWPALDLLIVATPLSLFIPTWFDPQGRFLHDRLVGTRLCVAP